jgi:hypothetical protein
MKVRTEDHKLLIEGDKAFNYYDMKEGVIAFIEEDGWFEFHENDGHKTTLNGERICTIEYATRRGWIK